MKHIFLKSSLVFIFFFMLIRPQEVFLGAKSGLMLWFNTVLPTLLPFVMISGLLIRTNAFSYMTMLFGPLLRRIFCISDAGSFAVLTGFLCGYPAGAKTTADLIRSGHITAQEGSYLLSFCNNTSFGFIMNFIFLTCLRRKDMLLPGILILTISPALASILFRRYYFHKYHLRTFASRPASGSSHTNVPFTLTMLDECLMSSLESVAGAGGYIMLFSVFISLLTSVLPEHPCGTAGSMLLFCIRAVFLPSLEITNGVLLLSKTFPDIMILFPAVCALSSFGGFCAAAQTGCMTQHTGLRLLPYIIEKLITAMVTSLLCVLYLSLYRS